MNFSMWKLGFSSQSKSEPGGVLEEAVEAMCFCECGSSGELASLVAESVSDSSLCAVLAPSETEAFDASDVYVRRHNMDAGGI